MCIRDRGILELYLPYDSFMRDPNIVGTALTVSTLRTGDLFIVNRSNFGLSTTNIDGLYRAHYVYDHTVDLTSIGIGTTVVKRVEIENVGFGSTAPGSFVRSRGLGEYTWGRVQFKNRVAAKALTFTPNGYAGLTTSPIIQRARPLKFNNYLV